MSDHNNRLPRRSFPGGLLASVTLPLSPRDRERCYILLCQSEPLTADVAVDCDN